MIPRFGVVTLTRNEANVQRLTTSLLYREPFVEDPVIVLDGMTAKPTICLKRPLLVDGVSPFVFARNANIGLRTVFEQLGHDYAILVNDDVSLFTPFGFTSMVEVFEAIDRKFGLLSPLVRGVIGNPGQREQEFHSQQGVHPQPVLHFVCVLIPRWIWEKVGPLDERFVGYGYEDNDYCERVQAAGHEVGVWSGTVVLHPAPGAVSTFRSGDWLPLYEQNRKLYEEKRARAALSA